MESGRMNSQGYAKDISGDSFIRLGVALFLICVVTAGCALVKLKQEVRESMSSTIIVGRVSGSSPASGCVIVAAYTKHFGRRKVAHYTVLHDWGEFELMVGKGRYHVFAFDDQNRNLVYDAGEPAGEFGGPKVVSAPSGGVVDHVDMVISPSPDSIDWRAGDPIASEVPPRLYSRLAGVIADLDDERFLDAHGRQGFWEPVTFYKKYGGTIYFLEEYDPKKIPILFIHGAGGTPRGWKYFVEGIDRTRFQPWFFYYPTGARMRSMSYLLLWKLANLQIKYHFDTLYITSHSMGGLVARSFIMDYSEGFPFVKLFISLATPWGGDKMAEYGVRQSPAVIPSWIDMQPEGGFIQSLYRAKMPERVRFYMFYGYRGSRNPFAANNDGTISLSSLLDRRPQAEAEMNYAFDEDHASIIDSKAVLDQYNTIINTHFTMDRASHPSAAGYLKLNFSYDYQSDSPRPWPNLILRTAGKSHMHTTISLSPEDNGKVLGPFPCGRYWLRLDAESVRTHKKWVPVSIESKTTHEVEFVFVPDGTISAYVTTALKPQDRAVGMPSWKNRPQNNPIELRSVKLTGPGIQRTLYPRDDIDWREMNASRKDYCVKGYLRFFGLPAGMYELVIQAKGYQTLVRELKVTPGTESAFRFYHLTPLKGDQHRPNQG
jgi:pimeloyl-ACP methyl ester carboxylesterase